MLVADLGATHGRLAVSTAAGEVIEEMVIESSIEKGPDAVLGTVTTELDSLLKHSGRSSDTLRGVGLGVPGPVDWPAGRTARPISMPGWDDYPVRDHLFSHYSVPSVVDNDANLLGLGEQRRIYSSAHLLLFVKVGTGIGASIVIDGELLRGSDSAEGDIGHAKIPGVAEICSSCSEPGCLAAVASGRAMVRDLRRLGHQPSTTRDVVDLVRQGNPDAVRIVTAAGRALGEVLSTAVSLLNPDVLVIGGARRPVRTSRMLTSGSSSARDTACCIAASRWRRPTSESHPRSSVTGRASPARLPWLPTPSLAAPRSMPSWLDVRPHPSPMLHPSRHCSSTERVPEPRHLPRSRSPIGRSTVCLAPG